MFVQAQSWAFILLFVELLVKSCLAKRALHCHFDKIALRAIASRATFRPFDQLILLHAELHVFVC